ncbi:RES family NAD+ phosphorylase [Azohydromonas lata]|uniref:RES family NAD+ phosphorylase n=1 Tax=Azohydromonas lata TaxID=45677 RepID=UPI0008308205|nr:RES family NAD+ phosphorylase [Azohydromonas lata]
MTLPPCIAPPWRPSYRLVPSRFPPVSLFDDVATADELDAVYAVQALTNPRLRQELGEIDLVPREERVVGPGSTPVMAAFTYLNRNGSRFSDGSWGVYYAAESVETAVAEVSHHSGRFLAATKQPAIEVDYRAYVADIVQPLHDIRAAEWAHAHAADSYAASVALARELRAAGSWGLLYRSVRREGGECVAVLRPRAVQLPVVQGAHVSLVWDGERIAGWYGKSAWQAVGKAG